MIEFQWHADNDGRVRIVVNGQPLADVPIEELDEARLKLDAELDGLVTQ